MTYTVYTDGSCNGKKQSGSAAIITIDGKLDRILCCSFSDSTNNRAELRAAILALRYVPEGSDIHIISDSKYVIGVLYNGWLEKWESINFEGKKNSDILKGVLSIKSKVNLTMSWVKGHAGDVFNELADSVAVTIGTKCINQMKDEHT